MSLDFLPPEKCPGVVAALRWLLRLPPAATPAWVMRRARYWLISTEPGGYWRVNANRAARLLRTSPPLPRDPKHLSEILYGIGELAAWSRCDFQSPLVRYMRGYLRRNPLTRLLDEATALAARGAPPYSVSELGRAQMVATARLEWQTYRNCEWFLWHPGGFSAPGRYGLKFIARMAAKLSPHALGRWIVGRKEHPSVAPIVATLVDDQAFRTQSEQARNLLSMPVPFLRCAGAAALIWPDGPHEWSGHRFREIFQELVRGGLPPGDALWMTASRLKDCFHRRFQLEHRIGELEQAISGLERFPDAAPGGRENAAKLAALHRTELEGAEQELPRLLAWIDNQLDEMAACYPTGGLTDDQHASLEPIFIDKAEFRYRLAERLPPGRERDTLLQRTIKRWMGDVERGDPYLWRSEDEKTLGWTARSFVLLHADRPHIGKSAGRLLGALLECPKKVVYQPYAQVRKPEEWRKAVGQIASAVLFAFAVIESSPTQRWREMEMLREHTIDTTFQLLVNAGRWWRDERLDHIARSSLWHMGSTPSLTSRIREWAGAEDLADFPRALAAWCLREPDADACLLAESLLLRVARFPMSENSLTAGFQRLLSLLDVASACRAGNSQTLPELWKQAYTAWDGVTQSCWQDAASWLAAAVEKDGPERQELLDKPEFTQSFCRAAIERGWPGNDSS